MSASLADLCPRFRYLKSVADETLREFFAAENQNERDAAMWRAVELARLIANVIEPLCRDAQQGGFASEYRKLSEKLYDLARPHVQFGTHDFPTPKDNTLLILDRLEQLEERIAAILKRRQGHSEERRAA